MPKISSFPLTLLGIPASRLRVRPFLSGSAAQQENLSSAAAAGSGQHHRCRRSECRNLEVPWDLLGVVEKCRTGCIRDEMQFNLDDVRNAGSMASKSGCGFLAFLLQTRHSVENKRIIFVQMIKNDADCHALLIGIGAENEHRELQHSSIGKWRLPVSRKPPSVLMREKDVWLAPYLRSRIPYAAVGYLGLHLALKGKPTNIWLTRINLIM